MSQSGDSCVSVRIHGRVQGVGYRAWTTRTATELGLSGWVRNRVDGTVEAFLVGRPDKIEEMIAVCELGPMLARVTRIDRWPAEHPDRSDRTSGFQALPTA